MPDSSVLLCFFIGIFMGFLLCWFEHLWAIKKGGEAPFSLYRAFFLGVLLGLSYSFLFAHFGSRLEMLIYSGFSGILCLIILTDLDTWIIPNPLVLALIILWFPLVAFHAEPWQSARDGLLAAFLVGGGLFVISAVYEQLRKKPSLGGGDIKLIFAVSLFFGLQASVFNLFLACLFGLIFSFVRNVLLRRTTVTSSQETTEENKLLQDDFPRQKESKDPLFPFGPSIALSSLVVLFGVIL